jgi:hypothetical protein
MDSEIERTIIHYYPKRALVSPLDDTDIRWDYDSDHKILKAILGELGKLDPELKQGTRGSAEISEELLLLDGELRLQLSYLAPYAVWNFEAEGDPNEEVREVRRRAEQILKKHGVAVLQSEELVESVPWIQHGLAVGRLATVWNCLFERD